jgi:hypothetical protein
MLGQFRPAVHRNPPLLGIQADDDVAGIFQAQIIDEMRFLHRLGADDDELDAGIEIGSTVSLFADAAADLDRQIGERPRRCGGSPGH